MRIVGGIYKGRRLQAPAGDDVRPTSDRVREAVFNVLLHGLADWPGDLAGVSVVDLFCGTGALGLEALSRGAGHVTLVDRSGGVLAAARKNAALGVEATRQVTILKIDATQLAPPPRAAQAPCGLAFLDAPYGAGLTVPALGSLKNRGWLAPGGLAVCEVSADEELAPPPGYTAHDERTYGAAKVVFLQLRD